MDEERKQLQDHCSCNREYADASAFTETGNRDTIVKTIRVFVRGDEYCISTPPPHPRYFTSLPNLVTNTQVFASTLATTAKAMRSPYINCDFLISDQTVTWKHLRKALKSKRLAKNFPARTPTDFLRLALDIATLQLQAPQALY